MDTVERYRQFADREAAGVSPTYQALATAVAGQPDLMQRMETLTWGHRQPNLLLAASTFLDAPLTDPDSYVSWLRDNWDRVAPIMAVRYTQTNEAARCATLLPLLARLPQPLALLEVGASAGLCLFPDKYFYDYDGTTVGDPTSPVHLDCAVTGPAPIPTQPPDVVWRAGIDLNPIDVTDPDELAWLSALIWPEHDERRARLRAAAQVVAADPPILVAGDLVTELPRLAARAPADATLVVFHSAVLAYLPSEARDTFVDLVTDLPGHWISNETAPEGAAIPGLSPQPFSLRLDGKPVALTGPHGQALHWLE